MLAAPFVDDAAPANRKALWFAILTSFPSLGVAGEFPLSSRILALPLHSCNTLYIAHRGLDSVSCCFKAFLQCCYLDLGSVTCEEVWLTHVRFFEGHGERIVHMSVPHGSV